MEQIQKTENKFANWLKTSATVRMIMVGFLTLILLIPLSFIESLIFERQMRQEEVVREINSKWGEEVLLYGPILKIPYKTYTKVYKEDKETKEGYFLREAKINYMYVFPNKLDNKAELFPDVKKRGMYSSVIYTGKMGISGNFTKPDLSVFDLKDEDVVWEKSKIIFQTSNLKNINNKIGIKMNKHKYIFMPKYSDKQVGGYQEIAMNSLESKTLKLSDVPDSASVNFNIDIDFNGSKQIRIIPIGEETTMNIKADWDSPKFTGNYLPYNPNKQTETSFDAKWKVLNINRSFAQLYSNQMPNLQEYAFGVELILPIDQYQQSMRTAKYGYLVIALTFLVFFLFQSISKVDIHPFQYLMIGVALTMFYTLLLSISEHSNFLIAYLIAGLSVIVLITFYSKSILKQWKFTLLISTSLTALYTFIYVIIQLENYALLVGSIGLFLILAAVMYASRKIDWK